MLKFDWQIETMDRQTSSGFVVMVHYSVFASDGQHSVRRYGSVGYTEQPGGAHIPYEQLTLDIVLGWVHNTLNKAKYENDLAKEIENLKKPLFFSGVPWEKKLIIEK
jgi:hypothetical protein